MKITSEDLQKVNALNSIYAGIISSGMFDISLSTSKQTCDKVGERGGEEEENRIKSNIRKFIRETKSLPHPGLRVGGENPYCYTIASVPEFEVGDSEVGTILIVIELE